MILLILKGKSAIISNEILNLIRSVVYHFNEVAFFSGKLVMSLALNKYDTMSWALLPWQPIVNKVRFTSLAALSKFLAEIQNLIINPI